MLVCFRLRRFDRGLSTMEAGSPDTRDGVRVLAGGTSSLGNLEELWDAALETVECGLGRAKGTVEAALPFRGPSAAGAFGIGIP